MTLTGMPAPMAADPHKLAAIHRSAIAEWLKAARAAVGKSQMDIATTLGVDKQTVSNWETERQAIGAEDFLKLVLLYDAFGPLRLLLAGEPFDDRPDYIRIAEKHGMQVAEGSPEPPGLERDEKKKPRRKGA